MDKYESSVQGEGTVQRAKMDASTAVDFTPKEGKVLRYKSKTVQEPNLMDARGMTDYAAKETMERMRYEQEKKLRKRLRKIK